MQIRLGNNFYNVGANASTLLIYDNEFVGRSLIEDVSKKINFDLSTAVRLVWATVKTANPEIESCFEWSAKFSIAEIIEVAPQCFDVVAKSFQSSKKPKKKTLAKILKSMLSKSQQQR